MCFLFVLNSSLVFTVRKQCENAYNLQRIWRITSWRLHNAVIQKFQHTGKTNTIRAWRRLRARSFLYKFVKLSTRWVHTGLLSRHMVNLVLHMALSWPPQSVNNVCVPLVGLGLWGSTSRAVKGTVRLVDCTAGCCCGLPHSWQRSWAMPLREAQHWSSTPTMGIRSATSEPRAIQSSGPHPPRTRAL